MRRRSGRNGPVVGFIENRALGWAVADHPDAMACVAASQGFGFKTGPFIYMDPGELERRQSDEHPFLDRTDAWLLGDPNDITFDSPEHLEQLIERAVERPAWRQSLSEGIGSRVRQRHTTACFAQRLIELVRGSLGS